jgi:5-aminolevulinate synthase
MDDLDVSARWQAGHPTYGSVGNRQLCADIVPGQRAFTLPNRTFATNANNCAGEAYERHFHGSLERLRREQRYRVFADIERNSGRFPAAKWRRSDGTVTEITVWCSNDYLGMGQHPEVVRALTATAQRCGAGAGGTRNIAGNSSPLVDLEGELADLHGKEASLVFTSGYVSNQAGISTIGKLIPDCMILSDAFNHNSIIEGVRQSSCEKRIFRHNDLSHLEALLREAGDRPKLVARPGRPSIIRPRPAEWGTIRSPSSISACGCAASRGCAWSMPLLCPT